MNGKKNEKDNFITLYVFINEINECLLSPVLIRSSRGLHSPDAGLHGHGEAPPTGQRTLRDLGHDVWRASSGRDDNTLRQLPQSLFQSLSLSVNVCA